MKRSPKNADVLIDMTRTGMHTFLFDAAMNVGEEAALRELENPAPSYEVLVMNASSTAQRFLDATKPFLGGAAPVRGAVEFTFAYSSGYMKGYTNTLRNNRRHYEHLLPAADLDVLLSANSDK